MMIFNYNVPEGYSATLDRGSLADFYHKLRENGIPAISYTARAVSEVKDGEEALSRDLVIVGAEFDLSARVVRTAQGTLIRVRLPDDGSVSCDALEKTLREFIAKPGTAIRSEPTQPNTSPGF